MLSKHQRLTHAARFLLRWKCPTSAQLLLRQKVLSAGCAGTVRATSTRTVGDFNPNLIYQPKTVLQIVCTTNQKKV